MQGLTGPALHNCEGAAGHSDTWSMVWQGCMSALHLRSIAMVPQKAVRVAGLAFLHAERCASASI